MPDLATVLVPACRLCPKPALSPRHGLCKACYGAVWRKTQRGDDWDSAVEERARQLARAAKGLIAGLRRRP